jgi:hypothetical protein
MVTENTNFTQAGSGHPSRLTLGRLLAGDVDASARLDLEKHVRACPDCNAAFAKAEQAAARFAGKYPTLESLAFGRTHRTSAPAPEPQGWLRRLTRAFEGGFGRRHAFAALGLLVFAAVIWQVNGRMGRDDLTAKGGTHFYLVHNGQQVRGADLACAPQDTLQFGIIGSDPVYYALLYRDDQGRIAPYMGGEGGAQQPLGNPQGQNLPHSLVLEGGWSSETIFCIWSNQPFTLDDAVKFAGNLEANPEPQGLHAQIFQLKNIRI